MKNVFYDIREMHRHYKIAVPKVPQEMNMTTQMFRVKFLEEELQEFVEALRNHDLPEQIDALIDLMVVASGTLDLMGVNGEEHWDEVLKCNMNKEVVASAAESKRGSPIDLKKPEGWEPPNHELLLSLQIEDVR